MAGMEGRGPYRIYDPGGGSEENGAAAFERLVEENTRLKEKMQGIKSIGNCCVDGDGVCLWGSSAHAHQAWGFLAPCRKLEEAGGLGTGAAIKLYSSLRIQQGVWAFSHRGAKGARLLLNSWDALWWDKWLGGKKKASVGARSAAWSPAVAGHRCWDLFCF